MTVLQAWRDGIRRVSRAPAILGGVWLMGALCVLPLAMQTTFPSRPGGPMNIAPITPDTVPWWWFVHIDAAAPLLGFGSAIRTLLLHPVAILNNAGPLMVGPAGLMYLIGWLFLSGGIIDRYARDRPTYAHGFFAAAGVYFFRFLRLGLVVAAVDAAAVSIFSALPMGMWLLLIACNVVFEFAQVRAVVEDRRSMLAALAASLSFIKRNWQGALTIYGLDAALFAAAHAVFFRLAPSEPGSSPSVFAISPQFWLAQLYVLARLWVRLVFWSTETAFFQSRLAHAGYVAAPRVVWPDSPSAEAIQR